MLSNADRARLEAGRLFGAFGVEDVEHLLDACAIKNLAADEHLLEPRAVNHHLYVVLDGELLVYPGGSGLPEPVTLGIGDCAGEMSLVHGHQASALVVASGETRLLAIPHDAVWAMIERSHDIARNLLSIIAGRTSNNSLALVANDASSLEFEIASSVDALTGLHNRRWMQDAFARAMQRCERDAAPLCLVLVDIDHFRRFNGDYGHMTGDSVLRMVARELVDGLRSQDLLVRYGGEVFALLLPNTTIESGYHIAERLRIAVGSRAMPVGDGKEEQVTISSGLTAMGLDDVLDNLLATAESALRLAKENGRDRVERA